MDKARKRQLKKQGKAEVERQSAAIHAALAEANPAPISSDEWMRNYRAGIRREKWLGNGPTVLHKDILHKLFAVIPADTNTWPPNSVVINREEGQAWHLLTDVVDHYLECRKCGSVVPTALLCDGYTEGEGCLCGNIELRLSDVLVRDLSAVHSVRLIGKA